MLGSDYMKKLKIPTVSKEEIIGHSFAAQGLSYQPGSLSPNWEESVLE